MGSLVVYAMTTVRVAVTDVPALFGEYAVGSILSMRL